MKPSSEKKQYYKFGKHVFRYDFDCDICEWVAKADEQMFDDNREWRAKYGKDLWNIDEYGYVVRQEVRFSRADWRNKADRDACLEMWCYEIAEETYTK